MRKFSFKHIGEDHNLSLDEATAVLVRVAERIQEDYQESLAYTYNKRDKRDRLSRLKIWKWSAMGLIDLIEAYIKQLPDKTE